MTPAEQKAYYANLLIIQYHADEAARAMIELFAGTTIADGLTQLVREAFDLDNAVGAQLDILAAYRGASRFLYGMGTDRLFMGMPRYGEDSGSFLGFGHYGAEPNWFFLRYSDHSSVIYTLSDEELRTLTKYLAKTDRSPVGLKDIDDLMFEFFGENVTVYDNFDMSITYVQLLSDTSTLFGIIAAIDALPRPSGVRAAAIRSETLDSFYGFQFYGEPNNPVFIGFSLYGDPKDGSFIRYA